VSREILQQSKQISTIKAGAVKKVLGLLRSMSKDTEVYEKFWSEFGNVIKEGVIEDQKNKDAIAKLLRFSSTHTDKEKQDVSLASYVERMKEGQDKIYYVTADSFSAAKNSPHLEVFRKKGIEVILMADRVDEWLISNLTEFDGKQLQSVAKGELDLDKLDTEEEKKEKEDTTKDFEAILKQMKEVLGDKVSEVRVTNRLTDSPACLVTGDHDMSLNMERIMKEAGQSMNMMGMGGSKPIFEINPTHALVTSIKNEQDDERFSDITNVLFDQAILSEGGQLDDPAAFVHKLNGLLLGLLK
jgi:molecular chaperone HtpG